jgi:hypothetical protein
MSKTEALDDMIDFVKELQEFHLTTNKDEGDLPFNVCDYVGMKEMRKEAAAELEQLKTELAKRGDIILDLQLAKRGDIILDLQRNYDRDAGLSDDGLLIVANVRADNNKLRAELDEMRETLDEALDYVNGQNKELYLKMCAVLAKYPGGEK